MLLFSLSQDTAPKLHFFPCAKRNQLWSPKLSAMPLKPTVVPPWGGGGQREEADGPYNYISALIPDFLQSFHQPPSRQSCLDKILFSSFLPDCSALTTQKPLKGIK